MITSEKKKIFLSCGEVSGDMNAANLVRRVRELAPNFEFVGIGGDKLRGAGVKVLVDSTSWGSIGILESISKTPVVYPALRKFPAMFRTENPDLFVPVDCRFINMRASAAAKKAGVPVVYFFAPVSWFGSGNKRFVQLAGTVDLALVTLPFSLAQYRDAGVNYEFIGHPLLDTAKATMAPGEAHEFFCTRPGAPVVGLMPGSRRQEIMRLMPVFAKTVEMIREKMPDAQFLLFRAAREFAPLIEKLAGDAPLIYADEKVYDFMEHCDVIILCSGTAAHEAAILMRPMVVTYKLSWFTAWLARKTVNPPFVALPNIVAKRFVAPELLQEDCTPEAVAGKTLQLLSDPDERCKITAGLCEVGAQLGEPGALDRAARRVVDAALGNIPDLRLPINADEHK